MPNISKTGDETFTEFSGFLGVIPRIPVQNMEGSAHQIFEEEVGKLNP